MWHAAQYRGEELIVLGHDPRRNDCMLVKMSALTFDEQRELRRIVASRSAQECSHLIPLLRRMSAPNGSDWFTYLANKMSQRNSPVFTLPIKEIQDSLDEDQKAIFKGYGKGRRNQTLDREDMSREFSGKELQEDDLSPSIIQNPEPVTTQTPVASRSLETKMDVLIETMADESRRTQQLLSTLIGVMAGDQPAKKARKPSGASKPKRHSAPRAEANTTEGLFHEAE